MATMHHRDRKQIDICGSRVFDGEYWSYVCLGQGMWMVVLIRLAVLWKKFTPRGGSAEFTTVLSLRAIVILHFYAIKPHIRSLTFQMPIPSVTCAT
ncbi:hypothetical protein BDR04DRAFT_259766 [Suillus decipiens]|nr:hypothetical protein BDR04DRAFT_259766 [Suillus decipiens]